MCDFIENEIDMIEKRGWEILNSIGIKKENFNINDLKTVDFSSLDYGQILAIAIATKTNIIL